MNHVSADFLEELSSLKTVSSATEHLIALMDSQGACTVHAWFGYERTSITCGNLPDWWLPHYYASNYAPFDYVRHHVMRRFDPIVWGLGIEENDPAVHPMALKSSQVAWEGYGLWNAIVFPVHMPNSGFSGGVSFGVDIDGHEFGRFLRERQSILHLAAMATHLKVQSLLLEASAEAVNLSNRERECLQWLAKGLLTARIAERLSIKDVTVNFYISKAKKKLKVLTREQAVAKAVLLGLIEA